MSNQIVHVTNATFDGVVTSERPVVVDFWAPWCGPCRVIAPVLDEIAREVGEQATIAKVNVDEEPALASRFGVQAIPQLVFFKDGVEKDRLVGAAPKREIVKRLDTLRD
jgi:thioredoxin 1